MLAARFSDLRSLFFLLSVCVFSRSISLQWFCWPILGLLLPYIIVVTIGIFLIQYAFSWCETDVGGGRESTVSLRRCCMHDRTKERSQERFEPARTLLLFRC